ncbi:unnamed protein product, partial [Didymodactylos carnosus]
SSTFVDRSSIFDENCNTQQPDLPPNDAFTSVLAPIFTGTFDDADLGLSSGSDNDIVIHSSSLSSVDDCSGDDELNAIRTNIHLPDHRPLHSSTSTTVYQFFLDILEFCRISRLPDNQRSHLLELFQKYLPSPNLVPKSGDDVLVKAAD